GRRRRGRARADRRPAVERPPRRRRGDGAATTLERARSPSRHWLPAAPELLAGTAPLVPPSRAPSLRARRSLDVIYGPARAALAGAAGIQRLAGVRHRALRSGSVRLGPDDRPPLRDLARPALPGRRSRRSRGALTPARAPVARARGRRVGAGGRRWRAEQRRRGVRAARPRRDHD